VTPPAGNVRDVPDTDSVVASYDGVRLRASGHVREIVLDRPAAHNALSTAMARSLAEACRAVAGDRSARAVVVSSAAPKAFCVGADLKERAGFTDDDLLRQRPVFRAAFAGVLDLPQPSIAAVHGFALGGGTEIALSCDLIVADRTAVLGLPEVTVGPHPRRWRHAAARPADRLQPRGRPDLHRSQAERRRGDRARPRRPACRAGGCARAGDRTGRGHRAELADRRTGGQEGAAAGVVR
jgi:hypothetical protein